MSEMPGDNSGGVALAGTIQLDGGRSLRFAPPKAFGVSGRLAPGQKRLTPRTGNLGLRSPAMRDR